MIDIRIPQQGFIVLDRSKCFEWKPGFAGKGLEDSGDVSFTRAAEELCVTHGAVSHQVKALETELGLQLFKRERNGLVITEAGRDYLAVVRDVFDRLELATDRLLQRQRSGTITVSTSPDFRRQMARQPAGVICRGLPRDRAETGSLYAPRRFCAGRCGPRYPAWRWAMAGARCGQSLR